MVSVCAAARRSFFLRVVRVVFVGSVSAASQSGRSLDRSVCITHFGAFVVLLGCAALFVPVVWGRGFVIALRRATV